MAIVVLESATARAEVDTDHGARLASLRVRGHEVLARVGASPIEWGCYPMAPWAGRVRRGRFTFDGVEFVLPPNLGDHAIHGTVFTSPWERDTDGSFVCELGPPWPFPGLVRQWIELGDGSLMLRLEVSATAGPMPAACGWHPWFRREVAGRPARLRFAPGYMLRRDADGIATRERVPPPPPPWDDCFGDVATAPVVEWPDTLALTLESDCDDWVVFDERPEALCVEPQTAPPDSLNHDPFVVRPGAPLVATTKWTWTVPGVGT